MRARRAGLWVALASLSTAVLVLLTAPRPAAAQGGLYAQPMPVYQTEGRDPVTFNTICATATWTQVVSSDTIARSTLFQSISSNTYSICLAPGLTAPSVQCSSTTAGPELAPNSALTDYSRAGWWCETSSGTVRQNLKGYRTRDRSDYGAIGANRGN